MTQTIVVTISVVLGAIGLAVGGRPVAQAAAAPEAEQVVQMTAKKFEYTPSEITLNRLDSRRSLVEQFESARKDLHDTDPGRSLDRYRDMANDLGFEGHMAWAAAMD